MTTARVVMALSIDSIAIPEGRVGYFDVGHAHRLGVDMVSNGQHDPIHVRLNGNAAKLPWTLVAGQHRLRGASVAGLATIDAIQVADATATVIDLRWLELSENLDHRQPRPIERAMFMAARARLEEEIDHPSRVGESQHQRGARIKHSAAATIAAAASATMVDAADWRTRTAAAMGCSLRTLEMYQRVHREIVEAMPDLAEALNFHPLGESLSNMSKLAGQNPDARRAAAKTILSRKDWPNLQAAMVASGLAMSTGNRVDPEKLGLVMMDAWSRLPLAGQRAHVEWLVENVTPGMAKDMVAGFAARGLL